MNVSIEIIHDGVFNLLSDMERLGLIRVNNTIKSKVTTTRKLSEQFAGALQLSDSAYESYQNALQEGRNEWNQSIY